MYPEDLDGDGFTECDGDCDDENPNLTPEDKDGDGISTCEGDCRDDDPTFNGDNCPRFGKNFPQALLQWALTTMNWDVP